MLTLTPLGRWIEDKQFLADKMSDAELGRMVGMSRQQIGAIKKGQSGTKADVVRSIAVALGATLADVQLALGHSRLDTTALYIHSDTERLRSIAHLASLTTAPQHPTQQNAPAQPGKQERRRVAVRRLR